MVLGFMGILYGFLTISFYDGEGLLIAENEYHCDLNQFNNGDEYLQSLKGVYSISNVTINDYYNTNANYDDTSRNDTFTLCDNNNVDASLIDRIDISLNYWDDDNYDNPTLVNYGVIYSFDIDRHAYTHNGYEDYLLDFTLIGGNWWTYRVNHNMLLSPYCAYRHGANIYHSTGEGISSIFYDTYMNDNTCSSLVASSGTCKFGVSIHLLGDTDLSDNSSLYSSGYNTGYNDGFNAGYNEGETDGTYAGYEDGYLYGYDIGFNEGENTANTYTFGNLFKSIVDTPIWFLQSLFGFSLFGQGETLMGIITSLITALIVIALVKKVF